MLAKVENILAVLNRASRARAWIARLRLHPLKGERAGQWAVTVRANWRIILRFDGADAVDVD